MAQLADRKYHFPTSTTKPLNLWFKGQPTFKINQHPGLSSHKILMIMLRKALIMEPLIPEVENMKFVMDTL